MLDDVTLALLGDREAQERITARGEVLSCAHCGGIMTIEYDSEGVEDTAGRKWAWTATCLKCCARTGLCYSREQVIAANNTRAPILSAEELERLKDGNENKN